MLVGFDLKEYTITWYDEKGNVLLKNQYDETNVKDSAGQIAIKLKARAWLRRPLEVAAAKRRRLWQREEAGRMILRSRGQVTRLWHHRPNSQAWRTSSRSGGSKGELTADKGTNRGAAHRRRGARALDQHCAPTHKM